MHAGAPREVGALRLLPKAVKCNCKCRQLTHKHPGSLPHNRLLLLRLVRGKCNSASAWRNTPVDWGKHVSIVLVVCWSRAGLLGSLAGLLMGGLLVVSTLFPGGLLWSLGGRSGALFAVSWCRGGDLLISSLSRDSLLVLIGRRGRSARSCDPCFPKQFRTVRM